MLLLLYFHLTYFIYTVEKTTGPKVLFRASIQLFNMEYGVDLFTLQHGLKLLLSLSSAPSLFRKSRIPHNQDASSCTEHNVVSTARTSPARQRSGQR